MQCKGIVRGSNLPVVFEFDAQSAISSATDISAAIYKGSNLLKHWQFDDLTVDNNTVIAPLTQQDTLDFPCGAITIEIKWVGENGAIRFNRQHHSHIVDRRDDTLLNAEDTAEPGDNPIEVVEAEPGVYVRMGYSPYINEQTGTWMEYDQIKDEFVDTGVEAHGADGKDGADGVTPEFSIGEVTSVSPDEGAKVTITGTPEEPILNMQIPRGLDGAPYDHSEEFTQLAAQVRQDADNAEEAAGRAEAALNNAGYVVFEIGEDGYLYANIADSLEDKMSFSITENGELEVSLNG